MMANPPPADGFQAMRDAAYLFAIVMIDPPFELSQELVERVDSYRMTHRPGERGAKVEPLRVVEGRGSSRGRTRPAIAKLPPGDDDL